MGSLSESTISPQLSQLVLNLVENRLVIQAADRNNNVQVVIVG